MARVPIFGPPNGTGDLLDVAEESVPVFVSTADAARGTSIREYIAGARAPRASAGYVRRPPRDVDRGRLHVGHPDV